MGFNLIKLLGCAGGGAVAAAERGSLKAVDLGHFIRDRLLMDRKN